MVQPQRGTLPILLVIGLPEEWPEAITRLANQNAIAVECIADIHRGAARLTMERKRIMGVLIDPDGLSRREWDMLGVLKRHIPQPIWSLPARTRREQSLAEGILPWEAAVRAFAQLLKALTPIGPEGNKGIFEVSTTVAKADLEGMEGPAGSNAELTHNGVQESPENGSEIPVASEVVEDYDDAKSGSVLSENEIRALLGP